jgi:CubicO group peptidase (beta-lactamase class C family)
VRVFSFYNDGTNASLPSASDPTYNMRAIALSLGLNRHVQKLDIARYMYAQPLQYTPGTNSAYSNYGFLLLSAIVEQVTGMPYFDYIQQQVLALLGITEVLLSSTEAQERNPSEAICEDQGLGLDPINITSSLLIPAVYGGDGQIKEVAAGCAGLAASATALTQFIHVNLVWGNGPRPNPSSNWWLGRTGSTPGASTEAASLAGGVDWAYVITEARGELTGARGRCWKLSSRFTFVDDRTKDTLGPLRDRPDFRLLMMDLPFPADPFAKSR